MTTTTFATATDLNSTSISDDTNSDHGAIAGPHKLSRSEINYQKFMWPSSWFSGRTLRKEVEWRKQQGTEVSHILKDIEQEIA